MRATMQVPGDVHSSLITAGVIPDPYMGRNEYDVRWVAEQDWIATREFEWNGEGQWHLDIDYLDTVAEIKINGKSVLKADNCFRRYRPDVSKALKRGKNKIEIHFFSNVAEAQKRQKAQPYYRALQHQQLPHPRWQHAAQTRLPLWLGLEPGDCALWGLWAAALLQDFECSALS